MCSTEGCNKIGLQWKKKEIFSSFDWIIFLCFFGQTSLDFFVGWREKIPCDKIACILGKQGGEREKSFILFVKNFTSFDWKQIKRYNLCSVYMENIVKKVNRVTENFYADERNLFDVKRAVSWVSYEKNSLKASKIPYDS